MPKMPGGGDDEKKEESAESREEAQEQVGATGYIFEILGLEEDQKVHFKIFLGLISTYNFVSTGPNVWL